MLVVCLGCPAGTWWTYLVNHGAGKGEPFGEAAANAFFLAAFSRYRQGLSDEGELKILASVERKRRDTVRERVRAARTVLDAPLQGETPPPGQNWNRTRFDLEMTSKLPGSPGAVVYEVVAEETYPIDHWPWQGSARLGGHPWTFTVRQDSAGGWWLVDFTHPDICAAYRRGYGCEVKDPSILPSSSPSTEPSPTPSPSQSGFNNWEFLPCGPRDPLREFHNCPTVTPTAAS